MQISIALCTYNGGRHLRTQLDSIRAQTLLPAELVVFDDGSSDDTAAILEQFAQTVSFPVRFFCNSVNVGSTRNFEQAMQRCQGEVIALCDQDDLWAPNKLARMMAVLEAEPELAGVFSNARLIDDDGKVLPDDLWLRQDFTLARQRRFNRSSAALQLIRRDTVTGATLIFRSSYLPWLLPIPAGWVHDGWIALLLASMAELRALPIWPMSYRLHAAQQVGAVQVALHSHLSTPVEKARRFHHQNATRWQDLLARMEELASLPGRKLQPAPYALAEVRRKVCFVQERATLLDNTRLRRILPALCLLPGYLRYEKGVLSLLRDLMHRVGDEA